MSKPASKTRVSAGASPSPASLPVVQPRGLRPSRPSFWRTISLIAVHLVMIAHVAHWLLHGVTLSPLEPSEGMELAKHGVVNAGLVFFAATIVVTAVFGRFFCGWGCHLIALQDLSRWLLIKIGIRPRPLRSRVLGLVPVIAFAYMFLWPAVYKLAVGAPLGPVRLGLLTSEFWATFPGLAVAAFTFFVCGFVVVFVLGSKGYCSYGCPYGAAFGLADRLAPIRVRVTDACRECATCTAVCTSNVRVHEEVRDRGMVVDPGCMKCLDCVANCPNGALYVGAGRPAMGRGRGSRRGGILTWPEEVLAGLVFVGGFVVFRGLYGVVPFLLALGLAAILAGLVVTAWRVVRRRDAWLGPLRLKAGGRIRPLGTAFLALMFPVLLVWAHSAGVRVLEWRGRALFETIAGLRHASLAIGTDRATLSEGDRQRLERARRVERWRMRLSPVTSSDGELRMAWLAFLTDDRGSAELHVDRALVRRPTDARAHLLAARMLVGDGRLEEAASAYDRVVELDPSNPAGYLGLGVVLGQSGRIEEALDVFARGLSTVPDSVDLRYNRGLSLAYLGDIDGAITDFERAVAADSGHLPARENLAGMLAAAGRFDEAIPVFEEAVRRSPNDPQLRIMAARACLGAGRRDCASGHIEAAIRLDPTLADLRRLLD